MPDFKNQHRMSLYVILLLVVIGLCSGILSGLVGVGGGIIIVPALVFFLGFTQHQAQGTSLGLLLLPVGILAVLNYYKQGHIEIKVVLIMSVAFVLGGWLGSRLAIVLSEQVIKRIFAVILFYAAFKMLGWDKAFVNLFR
jgi:uncharacterized membrane protein YfcA